MKKPQPFKKAPSNTVPFPPAKGASSGKFPAKPAAGKPAFMDRFKKK